MTTIDALAHVVLSLSEDGDLPECINYSQSSAEVGIHPAMTAEEICGAIEKVTKAAAVLVTLDSRVLTQLMPYGLGVAFEAHEKLPRLVVIESPYRHPNAPHARHYERYARACLADSLKRGEAPIVSHLLHTQVLDDTDPDDRRQGITAGHAWIPRAHSVVFYADYGITLGMSEALAVAEKHNIPCVLRLLPEWSEEQDKPTATPVGTSDGNLPNATLDERDGERSSERGGNAPGACAPTATAVRSSVDADPATTIPSAQPAGDPGWLLPSRDELEAESSAPAKEDSIVTKIVNALMSSEPPGPFVFAVAAIGMILLAVIGDG